MNDQYSTDKSRWIDQLPTHGFRIKFSPLTYKWPFNPRLWLTIFLTILVFDRWAVFNIPLANLDGSWIIAIHLAHQLGLVYGTDFVFTYGPLSWLVTRLPIGVSAWPIVLFDGLWLLNVSIVLWAAIGANATLKRILFLTIAVIIHRQCVGAEIPFSFYFFVLFYLAYHQRTANPWALASAVGLAVLTFYLKANVGLVSVCSVLVYGLWPISKNLLARLLSVGGLLVTLALSAYYLPVRLYPYLLAQWHLIDSYNDVMYDLQDRRALTAAVLILGISAVLFGVALQKIWRTKKVAVFLQHDGLMLLLIILQVFVLFKESFVRADSGHTVLFFKYGLLPFGLLALFCHTSLLRRVALVPVTLIPLAAPWLVSYHWEPRIFYHWIPQLVAYSKDILDPQIHKIVPETSHWPKHWLTQLRGKRVDILPHGISLLFSNNFHYAPRPVIQSYQVTDEYLDSLNATYFLSDHAPDYVLVTLSAIDNRDPFADETATKLALLRAYHVADSTNTWLLLQRRQKPLAMTLVRTDTIDAHLNESITVPADTSNVQLWKVYGHYSARGYLTRVLFQPLRLKLQLDYQAHDLKEYRTALPLLKDGFLLTIHPRDSKELKKYWQSMGQSPSSARVKSLRISSDERFFSAYNPSVKITRLYYHLEDTDPSIGKLPSTD